jgi:CopG family transcriptional regulator, nickel-responsive regulator
MTSKTSTMQRITMTFDDELMAEIDEYMAATGHQNRSEAVRDLVRDSLKKRPEVDDVNRPCVGAVVYVYDHETRELAKRILHDHHGHSNLSIASMHVHMDEHSCLEVSLLKGPRGEVEHFGRHVIAEKGVRYGELVVVPSTLVKSGSEKIKGHVHSRPHKH